MNMVQQSSRFAVNEKKKNTSPFNGRSGVRRTQLSIEVPKLKSYKSTSSITSTKGTPVTTTICCSPSVFSMTSPKAPTTALLNNGGDGDGFEIELAQKARYDPTPWQTVQQINVPQCRKRLNIHQAVHDDDDDDEVVKDLSDEAFYMRHYHSFLSHTKRENEILQRQKQKKRSRTEDDDMSNNVDTKTPENSLLRTNDDDTPIIPSGLARTPNFNYSPYNSKQKKRRRGKSSSSWSRPNEPIWYVEDEPRYKQITYDLEQKELNNNHNNNSSNHSVRRRRKSSRDKQQKLQKSSWSSSSITAVASSPPSPLPPPKEPDPRQILLEKRALLLEQLRKVRNRKK